MTIATLAADLDAMLADLGVAVSYGSSPVQATNGLFRQDSASILDDGALTEIQGAQKLRIRTGSLTGLANNQTITIGGTPYTIRDVKPPAIDGTTVITVV